MSRLWLLVCDACGRAFEQPPEADRDAYPRLAITRLGSAYVCAADLCFDCWEKLGPHLPGVLRTELAHTPHRARAPVEGPLVSVERRCDVCRELAPSPNRSPSLVLVRGVRHCTPCQLAEHDSHVDERNARYREGNWRKLQLGAFP